MVAGSSFGESEDYIPESGIEKFLSSTAEYGFVIGDECGVVLGKSSSNGILKLTVSLKEELTLSGKVEGNALKGKLKDEKFELHFNEDGIGKGILDNGTPIYLFKGKKTTDGELISYSMSQGMVMSEVMEVVRKNRFPGHDAIGYYSYREKGYMVNTYVFKTGFNHYAYGLQPKIRSFTAEKKNGNWSLWEDNSAYK